MQTRFWKTEAELDSGKKEPGTKQALTILSSTATQDTRAQDGNEPKKRRERHWTENSTTAKSDGQGTKEGKYLIRTKEYRAQSKINDTRSLKRDF